MAVNKRRHKKRRHRAFGFVLKLQSVCCVTWLLLGLGLLQGAELSPETLSVLEKPSHQLDQRVQNELESVWREAVMPVLNSMTASSETTSRVWAEKHDTYSFIHFFAKDVASEAHMKVEIHRFWGGKDEITDTYGRWFKPVQFADMRIESVSGFGDQAAFSTLTEDGSESFYWQQGEWFVKVNAAQGVRNLAKELHQKISDSKLWDFPKSPNQTSLEVTYDLPSLSAQIDQFRFYESGETNPSMTQRHYQDQFARESARYIFFELILKHPAPGLKRPFTLVARWTNPKGVQFAETPLQTFIDPAWTSSTHTVGWGWKESGKWEPGVYQVELSFNGRTITRKQFEITGSFQQNQGQIDISPINATLAQIRFFETSSEMVSPEERVYRTTFPQKESRYINWQVDLKHPDPQAKVPFQLTARYINPEGSLFFEMALDTFILPGQSFSSHTTGWGWPQAGNWKAGTFRLDVFFQDKRIGQSQFQVVNDEDMTVEEGQAPQETQRGDDLVQSLLSLSLADHLRLVDRFLSLKQNEIGAHSAWIEAHRKLWEAGAKWEFYQSADAGRLSYAQKPPLFLVPYQGDLSFDPSPLSPLVHLTLAWDKMSQMAAGNRVQSVQYTELQQRQNQALEQASDDLKKAIQVLEDAMGHRIDQVAGTRFVVQIPAAFQAQQTSVNRPISTVRTDQNGKTIATIYVRLLDADYEITPQLYAQKQQEALGAKFPNLSLFRLESSTGSGYEFTLRYSYQYFWEDQPVSAATVISKSGQRAVELNYVSEAVYFDADEMENLFKSFLSLPE